MKNIILITLFSLFLFSCKKEDINKDLVPEKSPIHTIKYPEGTTDTITEFTQYILPSGVVIDTLIYNSITHSIHGYCGHEHECISINSNYIINNGSFRLSFNYDLGQNSLAYTHFVSNKGIMLSTCELLNKKGCIDTTIYIDPSITCVKLFFVFPYTKNFDINNIVLTN